MSSQSAVAYVTETTEILFVSVDQALLRCRDEHNDVINVGCYATDSWRWRSGDFTTL